MQPTSSPDPAGRSHPGRSARSGRGVQVAGYIGWLLLALISMAVTYGALVFIGR